MLTILITIIAIIGWIGCVYYYGKAKENGHLFELSKGYEESAQKAVNSAYNLKMDAMMYGFTSTGTTPPKTRYNKDGSIAKKRGRKSNVETT